MTVSRKMAVLEDFTGKRIRRVKTRDTNKTQSLGIFILGQYLLLSD